MTPQEQQLQEIGDNKMIDTMPTKLDVKSIMPSTQFWYLTGIGSVIVYFVWRNLTKNWKES